MRIRLKTLASLLAPLLMGGLQPSAFAQAPRETPDFRQLFEQAEAAKAAGRYDQALAGFEQLEKLDPKVAEVHATLGLLCYQRGDFARAADQIRLARRLKPSLPGLDTLLAFSLAESGHEREALPAIEKAFRTSSDPAVKRQAGLELMRAYDHLEMDRQAAETALQMRDLAKDDPEVLYNTGKILGNSAYLTMQSLFHVAGDSFWAQLAEAEALESQQQYEPALAHLRRVLELAPGRPGIHYRIGRVCLSRFRQDHDPGDRQTAAREFAAELEVDPANGNAAYEIAVLAAEAGNQDESRRQYEQLLARYPDFEEALVGLGGSLLELGQPENAIAPLTRATQLRPADEVAWYRLSQACRGAGDRQGQQKAMSEFRHLHSTTPAGMRRPNAQDITPQQLGAEAPNP